MCLNLLLLLYCKVREHNRKLRKEAKKKGISRKPKKDIGVPNSAPFKEEVLREAEQRKQELETLKEQNKIAKPQERAAKRKKEKEAASAGDEPATKKAKKVRNVEMVTIGISIQQFISSVSLRITVAPFWRI
uniref:Guanine nucleotide-binding protein-like 3 N-terminal domain-containing protein n=1 Tax=Sinocyclocheilus rhinocerous TaxID=307959 RepID=A0A673GW54_9TELE